MPVPREKILAVVRVSLTTLRSSKGVAVSSLHSSFCHQSSNINEIGSAVSASALAAAAAGRPDNQRRYSQQYRFFGESRVTPRGTPRGTPSASRRPSKVNVVEES